ncbi:type III secretion system chaperone family protein [Erythrobacter rubeus]|uniref:YbjN domain-containing protein n=1 Tax=Erythrobacter rubeus TaxID=2760803 RepID=A0ABR8KNZ9_9SPHN|nr:YbjN domain-containing protein [Erythrobacter rubeus]MBD2841574.1 hypothetical protein [Erythrobacter rubeus]
MSKTVSIIAAGALAVCAPAAIAQDSAMPMVSAGDVQGVMNVLRSAGYDVELFERKDDEDTTFIEIDTAIGVNQVRFTDCAPAVPDFCETLVLSAWWDRETPISDEALAAANKQNKYVSVFRASDGDPVMQWAILTRREGIPATVFLNAVQRFSGITRDYRDVVFENDGAGEEAATATNETGEGDGSDAE